ncbi:MAG: hypothetical protein ACO27F_07735 [Beijerinckiaceae bacterium]|jgi:hypothetical protein
MSIEPIDNNIEPHKDKSDDKKTKDDKKLDEAAELEIRNFMIKTFMIRDPMKVRERLKENKS